MAKERKMEPQAEAAEAQTQEQGQGISLDQALKIITEALEAGNKAGAFTLQEATTITNIWSGLTNMIVESQKQEAEK